MKVNERLIKLREQKELLQKDVATAIGMDRSVYNKIETGTRPIRDRELLSLANFYNVSIDYLITGDSSKKNWHAFSHAEFDIVDLIANHELSPEHTAIIKRIAVLNRNELKIIEGTLNGIEKLKTD